MESRPTPDEECTSIWTVLGTLIFVLTIAFAVGWAIVSTSQRPPLDPEVERAASPYTP